MKKKRKSSLWGTSLRKFSWGKSSVKTNEQSLYESTVLEWYDAKHREASKEEITYFNNLKIEKCPFCESKRFIKYGTKESGLQIYKCKDCEKKFSVLSNTVFDQRKIPLSEWIEYLIHLFEFHSISSTARDNRNAASTGRYWLYKVFEVLKHYQDNIILSGKVYIDEMYLPQIKSKNKIVDGKKLKGLSKNKFCISTGTDGYRCFFLKQGMGKPSLKKAIETYGKHIKSESTLYHDFEKSHNILISELNLKEHSFKSINLKKKTDDLNPLDPINDLHGYAKKFMKAHGGYNRENIDDWMNLLAFIFNPPLSRDEKILEFIKMALKTTKVIRYRDVMSKKER